MLLLLQQIWLWLVVVVVFWDKGGCPHQHWGTAAMATQLAGATTSLEERVLLSGFSTEFVKELQLVVNDVCWGAAGRKVCAYRHCGVVVFVSPPSRAGVYGDLMLCGLHRRRFALYYSRVAMSFPPYCQWRRCHHAECCLQQIVCQQRILGMVCVVCTMCLA